MGFKTCLYKIFSHCFCESHPLSDSPPQLHEKLFFGQIQMKEGEGDYIEFDVYGRQLKEVFEKVTERETNNMLKERREGHDGRSASQQGDLTDLEFGVEPSGEIVSSESDNANALAGNQNAFPKLLEVSSRGFAMQCENNKDFSLLTTTSQEFLIAKPAGIQGVNSAAIVDDESNSTRTISLDSLSDQANDYSENVHGGAGEERGRRGDAKVPTTEVEIVEGSPSGELDARNPEHYIASPAILKTVDPKLFYENHCHQKSAQHIDHSEHKSENHGSSRPQGQKRRRGKKRVCFRCGKKGHIARNCYSKFHRDGYMLRPLEVKPDLHGKLPAENVGA